MKSGRLSKREMEVMRLVSQGYSNPYIAKTLFIAPTTVANTLEKACDKMLITGPDSNYHRRVLAVIRFEEYLKGEEVSCD